MITLAYIVGMNTLGSAIGTISAVIIKPGKTVSSLINFETFFLRLMSCFVIF